MRYGLEDVAFGYRVHANGGLLVPVRSDTWHQDDIGADGTAKRRDIELQYRKAAHRIPHPP